MHLYIFTTQRTTFTNPQIEAFKKGVLFKSDDAMEKYANELQKKDGNSDSGYILFKVTCSPSKTLDSLSNTLSEIDLSQFTFTNIQYALISKFQRTRFKAVEFKKLDQNEDRPISKEYQEVTQTIAPDLIPAPSFEVAQNRQNAEVSLDTEKKPKKTIYFRTLFGDSLRVELNSTKSLDESRDKIVAATKCSLEIKGSAAINDYSLFRFIFRGKQIDTSVPLKEVLPLEDTVMEQESPRVDIVLRMRGD